MIRDKRADNRPIPICGWYPTYSGNYQYSMGIGDAWSVQWLSHKYNLKGKVMETRWRPGMQYHYGIGEAHYPVPALLLECEIGEHYVALFLPDEDFSIVAWFSD